MRYHFVFAGPVQHVHCGTCSTCMGNRKAEHSVLLAAHEISRDFAAPWLALPVLNMRHSAQAVLAQRRQNGSALVPKNWMSIATNSVLFTSDSIFKVTKSEEYCIRHYICVQLFSRFWPDAVIREGLISRFC